MPPLRRPAAAGAEAKAKARLRPGPGRGALRRPARAGEDEERGDQNISERFRAGEEVKGLELPLAELRKGTKLLIKEANYWEEKLSMVGIIQGLEMDGDQVKLKRG